MYQVDEGIPKPNRLGRAQDRKYPWAEMRVGDSFFVPHMTPKGMSVRASKAGRDFHRRFSVRKWEQEVDGVLVKGVRVWRDPDD